VRDPLVWAFLGCFWPTVSNQDLSSLGRRHSRVIDFAPRRAGSLKVRGVVPAAKRVIVWSIVGQSPVATVVSPASEPVSRSITRSNAKCDGRIHPAGGESGGDISQGVLGLERVRHVLNHLARRASNAFRIAKERPMPRSAPVTVATEPEAAILSFPFSGWSLRTRPESRRITSDELVTDIRHCRIPVASTTRDGRFSRRSLRRALRAAPAGGRFQACACGKSETCASIPDTPPRLGGRPPPSCSPAAPGECAGVRPRRAG